jgi:ABC-type glycerol-3-phosphate transport system substrate-binding protein
MKKIVVLFITFGLIFGLMACDDSVVDPIVNPPDITDPVDPVDPVDTNEPKPAVITEKTDVLKVFTASSAAPDFTTYVTITDEIDGNVTVTPDMVDVSKVNMSAVGTFRVTYTYTNSSGLTTKYDIVFTINEEAKVFGNCDPNFPENQVNRQLNGTSVRLGTWMRNFLDPFFFTAKQTELNDMKKTCINRAKTEHNANLSWWAYDNALNHTNEIIQQYLSGNFKADFFNINSHNLGALADSGAIQPLNEYLKYLPDFYQDINLEMGSWKGDVYGIWTERINVNMGIYVNLELLEEYAQENPAVLWEKGEWDWDALVEIASNIKANAPENIEILGMNNYDLASYLIGSNGGKVINPNTDLFALNDPRAVNALMFAQELKERGYVWMSETNTDTGNRAKFTSGELVFYFASDWISGDPSILKPGSAVQFKLGMVPMPVGRDIVDFESEYRVPITVGNLWVMRSGMTPEEAESMFQFFANTIPWGNDVEQDERYTDTMRDHMDDRISLRAYVSASRYGYFEKSLLYGVVWGSTDSGVVGIGNVFAEIITDPGASVTAVIEASLPSIQGRIDERLGKRD